MTRDCRLPWRSGPLPRALNHRTRATCGRAVPIDSALVRRLASRSRSSSSSPPAARPPAGRERSYCPTPDDGDRNGREGARSSCPAAVQERRPDRRQGGLHRAPAAAPATRSTDADAHRDGRAEPRPAEPPLREGRTSAGRSTAGGRRCRAYKGTARRAKQIADVCRLRRRRRPAATRPAELSLSRPTSRATSRSSRPTSTAR